MSDLQQRRDAVVAHADALEQEIDYLFTQIEAVEDHPDAYDSVALAASQAKRVRNMTNRLVKSLAQLRDHLQA